MQIIFIVLPFNMAAVQNLYMPRETKASPKCHLLEIWWKGTPKEVLVMSTKLVYL